MFWATKSCFGDLNKNVNLSLMVSCQDDLISPTVILCSLNQTLSSSFSSYLQSFSCFILFYFLVHISASFVILPRPFPVFFFSLSLSLFSPHHFFSPSLLFPAATPLNLRSRENWKRGESAALTPSNNTTVLSFCADMSDPAGRNTHSLRIVHFPPFLWVPFHLLSRPSPLENLNLSFIASPLVKPVFLCS